MSSYSNGCDTGSGNGNSGGNSSSNSSAKNDSYTDTENNTLTLNVTSNDSGSGKTLYTLDQDNPRVVETTATTDLGATIKIVNGQIVYDPTSSSAIQALSQGQTAVDTFSYTIRLSNGQLSTATVRVTLTGTNDAPVLAADTSGPHTIVEHAGSTGQSGLDTSSATLNFTDAELLDTHSVSIGAAAAVWSGGSTLPSGLQALLNGAVKTSEYDSNILTQTAAAASTAFNGVLGAISTLFSGGGASSAANQAESALSTAISMYHPGSGSIGLNFSAADSVFDFLGAGETLKITYNVTVTDNHGASSTQPVTFTITGANDGPVLSTDAVANHALTELAGATGSAAADTATATLNFTDADLSDTHSVSIGAAAATWSGGGALPSGLQSALNAALKGVVADSTHTGSGSVGLTFSATDSAFDFLAAGETLKVTYNVTVTDAQGATSTQAVTFTVTGTNDAPVVSPDAAAVHGMSEIAGATAGSGAESASATLHFVDADLNDTHTVSVGAAAAVWSGGSALPIGLQATLNAAATANLSDSTHTGSGSVGVAFAAADKAFDFLSAGETLKVTYNVTVTDNNGATSTRPVTFTVTGTNDAPVLAADAVANHALTEQAGLTASAAADAASTTLNFTDVDLNDTHTASVGAASATWSGGGTLPSGLQAVLNSALTTTVADSTHSGSGSVGVAFSAADGAFDFLSAGETLKVTYNVTVTDAQGATSSQPVTFTVTGTNDAPVLSADRVAIHGMSEIAGATAGAGSESASTTLNFSDADLNDAHAVSVSGATAVWSGGSALPANLQSVLNGALSTTLNDGAHTGAGSVGVAFAAADSAFDFLSAGETLRVAYNVTVTDSQGAASTRTVTFVVTGTNDAPVLAADAVASHAMSEIAGVTGGAGSESASTTLNFTDVDLNDTHAASVGAATATWSGGSTLPSGLQAVLNSAVSTTLADSAHSGSGSVGVNFAAADSAFDFLAAGETLTVTYNVTVTDAHGAASTQAVTFTVTGTNDAPVLAADTGVHALTEIAGATHGAGIDFAAAALTFADVDLNDTHAVSVAHTATVWSGGSALPTGLQAMLDNAAQASVSDSTHSGAGAVGVAFAAADNAFDFLADGETLTVTYNVTVTDAQGATTTQPVTFTVTGTNDAPVLAADTSGAHAMTEHAGMTGGAGIDFAVAALTFTDVDLNDTHAVSVGAASAVWSGGSLPSGLQAVLDGAAQASVSDSTHSGAGAVGVAFAAADNAFDFLAAGETLNVTYNVTVTDAQGATSTQPVTFTVTGTDDAPFLSSDSGPHAIGEQAGVTGSAALDGAATVLTFTDADLNDTHNLSSALSSATWSGGSSLPAGLQAVLQNALQTTLADSTHTGSGQVAVNFAAPDGAFDFLAVGETLTVTYNVFVSDQGAGSFQPVTFVVTGTNDAPVLAADTGPHAITEQAGVTGSPASDSASTVLTFTDVDLNDGHAIGVSNPMITWSAHPGLPAGVQAAMANALTVGGADSTHTGTGTVALTFSAADGAFDFLAAGETLTVTYNVIVRDAQGATSAIQPVTFTVTGTNDIPVLAADTGVHAITEQAGVTGSNVADTASTTLNFTDADLTDMHSASATLASSTWSGGTIPTATVNALNAGLSLVKVDIGGSGTGQVTATLSAADHAFDFLGAGETLTATYNVTVADGHGGTSTQPVTFTVTGTNDAPVLSAPPVTNQTFSFDADSGTAVYNGANNSWHFADGGFTFNGFYAGPNLGVGNSPAPYIRTAWGPQAGGELGEVVRSDGAEFSMSQFATEDYYLALHSNNETAGDTLTIKGYDHGHLVATQVVSLTSAYQTVTLGSGFGQVDDVQFFLANSTTTSPLLALFDNMAVGAPGSSAVIKLAEAANFTGSAAANAGMTTLAFTDVDLNDHHTASVSAPTAVWSGGAALPDGLIAALTGALTPSVADSTGTGSGSIAASFSAQDHTFDFLAAGETLTVTYNLTVDDGHGGTSTQPVTITVTGTNDAPVMAADASIHGMTEIAGVTAGSGVDSASTSLSFSDADLTDTHAVSFGHASATWSGGSDLPDGLQSVLDGALHTTLADSTHTGTGSVGVNFTAADNAFDFLGAGETLTVTYGVSVTDSHGAVSTQPVTFTVTGTNDAPVMDVQSEPQWTPSEAAGVTGFTGSAGAMTWLAFTDVDLNDSHTVTLGAATAVWTGGSALPDGLQAVLDNAASPSLMADSTGSGSGVVGVTFIAADNSFDFLSDGETLTVTYDVRVSDGHGGTSTQPISFLVTGTNDAPVVAADTASHDMAEIAGDTAGSGVESASASLSFTDVDLNDSHAVSIGSASAEWSGGSNLPAGLQSVLDGALHASLADTTHGAAGSVNLAFTAADNAFDFLGAGEVLTATYNVTVSDSHGGTSTQPVAFTVTGTNDAPVLAADSGVHVVVEQLVQTGSAALDGAASTLSFTDTDLNDTHSVSFSQASAIWSGGSALPTSLPSILDNAAHANLADSAHTGTGTVGINFSAPDGAFDFLGVGETLTVTYGVTVTDSQGATSTQPVTFTVLGTDDAPVLAADAGSHGITEIAGVTAGSGVDSASTSLSFSDADLNDTHVVWVNNASAAWSGGSVLPGGLQSELDGALQATLADSAHTGAGSVGLNFSAADGAFDFLGAGETLTVTYDVTVDEYQGRTSTQPVTFTVTGTNDAPVLAAAAGGSGVTGGATETFGFEYTDNAYSISGYDQSGAYFDGLIDNDFTFHGLQWDSGWGGNPNESNGSAETGYGYYYLDGGAQAEWQRSDGQAFSMHSFDVQDYYTTYYGYGPGQITVEGFLNGQVVASETFQINGGFQTLTFDSSFADVDDVKLFVDQPGYYLELDNVTVGGVTHNGAIAFQETAGATGSTSALGGSVSLDFSDADLTDHHTASVSSPTAVWSGGSALPDGLIAALTGALTPSVADATGTGSGSVTASFSAQDHTFDFLAEGEILTVTYDVTVDDGHGGTSSQPITVVIVGSNDAPVVAVDATSSHAAAEATNGSATQVASAALGFADADLNDTHSAGVSLDTVVWSANGNVPNQTVSALYSALTATLSDSQGSGAGHVNLNFALADSAMAFLSAGETLKVTYDVTVTDNHGLTSTQPVSITLTGVNAAPVLTSTDLVTNGGFEQGSTGWTNTGSGGAVEVNGAGVYGVSGFSGNVLEIDANGGLPIDDVFQTVATVSGATYTFSFDAALRTGTGGSDNTFGVYWNGQLIDTVTPASTNAEHHSYTVTGNGSPGTVEFREESYNSNGLGGIIDNVSLKAGSAAIAVTEQSGSHLIQADTGSATFTLTDVNLDDTHSVAFDAASAVWSGGSQLPSGLQAVLNQALSTNLSDSTGSGAGAVSVQFSAEDQAFDFLAAGETLKVTYNVTVSDNHGGSTVAPVTVTVTGTNDTVVNTTVAGGASGSITELAGVTGSSVQDTTTGVLAFADADLSDVHSASHGSPTFVWSGGTLSAGQISALTAASSLGLEETDSTGHGSGSVAWSYGITDGALDFLAAGQTLTETYGVTIDDGHGGANTQFVTITETGTNDAPVLATHSANQAATIGSAYSYTLPDGTFSDVDNSSLIWSATQADGTALPAWLTFNAATHTFSGTPQGSDMGDLSVKVTTSDGSATATEILALIVSGTRVGTIGADTLTGSSGADVLVGGPGADTLSGGAGNDTLYGYHATALAAADLVHDHTLVGGLGGTAGFGANALGANDDNFASVDLTPIFGSAGLNFFGHTFTSVNVDNNGYIDFATPSANFPEGTISATLQPIIAPFYADVDTAAQGNVYYDVDATDGIFTVTWNQVGAFPGTTTGNSFQLELIDRGNGDFDMVFRYGAIGWSTSVENPTDTSIARAGYYADSTHGLELAGSGNAASMLALPTTTGNTGIAGVWVYQVRDGVVSTTDGDRIDGGTGNDILTGGPSADTFVFSAPNFGQDKITDFTTGTDVLEINHTIFSTASVALTHAAQVGSDVIITYDTNDYIILSGVTLSNLHSTDFHII